MPDDLQPPLGDTPPDSFESPEGHLIALAARFTEALELRERGDVDTATDVLREILKAEPRLAEPRLELASVLIEQGRLDEAEEHAREAVRILDAGGQWTEDLPAAVVQSLAWATLGEALRLQSDADEVVFGDPEVWKAQVAEAREAYQRAAALDPENEHAAEWAFHLKVGA